MIDYLHVASWASWLLHEPNPDTPSVQEFFLTLYEYILYFVTLLCLVSSSPLLLSSPLLFYFVFEMRHIVLTD